MTQILLFRVILVIRILQIGGQEIISLGVGHAVVKGLIEGRNGQREYYAFKGIQYATADRWKDPVLKEFNDITYNATQFGESCPQLNGTKVVGEEQCLFLNIYTRILPDSSRVRSGEILNPVMVYIHGGGFASGSGRALGPRRLMTAEEKVVAISVNYRLGILGYLSSGERDLAGNWGLLDIIEALDWIQKYIRYFGGDPNRVTIIGHSAGGAAVHLMTLSPRATGKFHRAILISGNGFCGSNLELEPLKYLEKVGTFMACPVDPRAQMISCLRNQSIEKLLIAQQHFIDFWIYPKNTVPVVDGKARGSLAVLPGDPLTLFDAQRTIPVHMMVGVMKDEGLHGYTVIHTTFGNTNFRNTSYFTSEIVPRFLRAALKLEASDPASQALSHLVLENYFKNVNMSDEVSFQLAVNEFVELVGDVLYYSCNRQFLEKYGVQSLTTPVYSYVFSHKTATSSSIIAKNLQTLRQQGVNLPIFDTGVAHIQDAIYIFDPVVYLDRTPLQTMSTADESVALAYTRSLIAFAKSGVPLGMPDPIRDVWKPIRPGDLRYFNVSSISVPMDNDFRKRNAIFWLRTAPHLMKSSRAAAQTKSAFEKTEVTSNAFQILFWLILTLAVVLVLAVIVLGFILWRKRTSGQATL